MGWIRQLSRKPKESQKKLPGNERWSATRDTAGQKNHHRKGPSVLNIAMEVNTGTSGPHCCPIECLEGQIWACDLVLADLGGQLPLYSLNSSTLAWKIPWTEEPGGLQSMGSLRVGHDWVTSLLLFTFMHWRRKWQPTPVFLPGESQGWWSLVGCRIWGHTDSDTTEVT